MARWDVAIVGGGPAGAIAATVLARAGRKVLLVSEVQSAAGRIGESLPSAARPLLKSLGLLATVEAGGHGVAYGNLSAWGSPELVASDFLRDPHGLGWHLDRARFDAQLREVARSAGVRDLDGRARVVARGGEFLVEVAEGADVHGAAEGADVHEAAWVIDASGRRATIARSLGAVRRRDPPLVALWAKEASRTPDVDTYTLVESAPDGWFYSAPVPGGERVVAFHCDTTRAAAILRTPGAWLRTIERTNHLRSKLEGIDWRAPPRANDAAGAWLERAVGKRWLATGDAAVAFDPLSSQGLFNALYTGMKAGQAVVHALDGRERALVEYAYRLERIRTFYRTHHAAIYGAERRWLDRPFWRRRSLALAA